MLISKDIYEYITHFVDDKTVLNMFSVNKKFSGDEYFGRFMQRKYPFLCDYFTFNKTPLNEWTWKSLFIGMIYSIDKLEKDYGIPYIPTEGYNPKHLLTRDKERIPVMAAYEAVKGGHLDILKIILEKEKLRPHELNELFSTARWYDRTNIVNFLAEKGAKEFFKDQGYKYNIP